MTKRHTVWYTVSILTEKRSGVRKDAFLRGALCALSGADMKMCYLFFGLFLIDSVLAVLMTGPHGDKKTYVALKALLMPLLFLGCAVLREEPVLLPLAGLFFGWLGDILLAMRGKKAFMFGMLAFAVGHILYIAACLRLCVKVTVPELIAAGIFFLIYAVFLFAGRPRLTLLKGKLAAAATAYALLLSVLGFSAALLCLSMRTLLSGIVLLGAILFIFSDSMLSLQSFRKKTPHGNMAVIGTYAAAQACIAIGLTLLN